MDWFSKLFKRKPGTIRRFHGTHTNNLSDIVSRGLEPRDPGYGTSDEPGIGVYTAVHPEYFHEMPGDALITIDIPKTQYRQMFRLPHNPETPEYRYGMGLTERQNTSDDLIDRFIIDTINDKGRVDIFSDVLSPDWFTDVLYVGPDNNIYRYNRRTIPVLDDWSKVPADDITGKYSTTDELIGPSVFRELKTKY